MSPVDDVFRCVETRQRGSQSQLPLVLVKFQCSIKLFTIVADFPGRKAEDSIAVLVVLSVAIEAKVGEVLGAGVGRVSIEVSKLSLFYVKGSS
jgi:hypothetical protein